MSINTRLDGSNRVKLTGFDWIEYYTFCLIFLVPVAMSVYDAFVERWRLSDTRTMYIDFLFLIAAIFAFWFRTQGLSYKSIVVSDSRRQAYAAVLNGFENRNWAVVASEPEKSIIAQTPGAGFSWGELVVVHFLDGKVLANSISNPAKAAMTPWKHSANIRELHAMVTDMKD